MEQGTVRNTATTTLRLSGDYRGNLVAIEGMQDIPFSVSRVYFITNVPEGQRRGYHAHRALEQLLLCPHGSVKILLDDGERSEVVVLDSASKGLYVGSMVWREMFDFPKGSVLLVLASEHYNPSDYEKDYGRFKEEAQLYYQGR